MKFNEAMDSFLKFSSVHHSRGTRQYYYGKEKYLRHFFGKMNTDRINGNDLLDFIISQRKRNSDITNATLNKYVAALKFILKTQCDIIIQSRKLPEINKVIPVIPNNVIDVVFQYYNVAEKTNTNQRNNLMFRMLLDTGLRINELINLKVSDLDFDTSTIHVKITKTKTERYTFFSEETHLLLTKYILANHIKEYLFQDFKTKKKLKVDHIETICYRLKNKLNINAPINPHRWRHTFATRFQKKNKNIEVLRMILGHTKLASTQIYVHLDKEDLHEVYFSKL